jgi:hypothetical protein
MENQIAMSMAKHTLGKGKDQLMAVVSHNDDHYKDVKWDDYNFPPLLNIYHFSMSEISKEHKYWVSKLVICYYGSILCLLINLGNEIFFMFISEWTFK